MSNPAAIPFSVWRKIAMASWRPRKDPMITTTLDVDVWPDTQLHRGRTPGHWHPRDTRPPGRGRAAAKVLEALPGLNGRVVFGSFAPSPTIDGFFVVSLRTDPVAGKGGGRHRPVRIRHPGG